MQKRYDCLHIRDYFPSLENQASSPWVYDQVKGLKSLNINSLVVSPTPYLPSFLRSTKKFYLYPKPNSKKVTFKEVDVIRPQYYKIPNNKLVSLTLNNLSNVISKASTAYSFSLIHSHFGQNGYAALELKQERNIPLITSFYGYDAGRLAPTYAKFYKKLANEGDLFLVLSQDMKNDLLNLGFPEEKVQIHHLGIDLNQFNSNMVIKNKDNFVYLVVARLDEAKGVQDVIRAFSIIKKSGMQLRIVGDGKYKMNLIRLVKELSLEKQVIFINNFITKDPRQVVVDEMKNSDVVLLTSFNNMSGAKEGTPVVLMEAQACGKPCIATKHAGIPEVVIDNKTGFLAEERDIDFIADKMQLLFKNSNIRNKMGKNAYEHIKINFNQEVQIKRLKSIYNSLIF